MTQERRVTVGLRSVGMARDRLTARRKAVGHTQTSLALAIGCARSTVARWERDESEVAPWHRDPLAREMEVSLTDLETLLNGQAAPHPEHGWWSNYETLEQSATAVSNYEPVLIPGLLQVKEYAGALLDDEDLLLRRMDRQQMLTRPNNPVQLTVVLDESVLQRPIGGATVLIKQLRHLVIMAERPNVSIEVLPLDAPSQPLYWGALVLLEFPWPGGLLYLEHRGGAHYLDSRHDIENHKAAFARLRELALSPEASLRKIKEEAQKDSRAL